MRQLVQCVIVPGLAPEFVHLGLENRHDGVEGGLHARIVAVECGGRVGHDVGVADVAGDHVGLVTGVPFRIRDAVVGHRGDDIAGALDVGDLLFLDGQQRGITVDGAIDLGAFLRVRLVPLGGHDVAAQRDRDDLVFGLRMGTHDEAFDAGRIARGWFELMLLEVVGIGQFHERL